MTTNVQNHLHALIVAALHREQVAGLTKATDLSEAIIAALAQADHLRITAGPGLSPQAKLVAFIASRPNLASVTSAVVNGERTIVQTQDTLAAVAISDRAHELGLRRLDIENDGRGHFTYRYGY